MTNLEEGKSSQSVEVIGINLTELKEALLTGIEKMEAILQEVEATASNEAQQYEELRQRADEKIGLLEAQLQEREESLRLKESAIRQLEENLTAKIKEINQLVTEKEALAGLLEKHNSEITILRSETEAKVSMHEAQLQEMEENLNTKIQELNQLVTEKENLSSLLERLNSEITILRSETEAKVSLLEAQLQDREETLRSKESAIKQLGESLTSKIQELNQLVTEKEALPGLLEKHDSEIAILRSQTEAKVGLLEAQLQEREKALRKKESSSLQLEESFTAEIQGLEEQLREKESLLESRQADLNDLRSKLDELTGGSQDIVTLREEDVVTINLLDHNGEKGITSAEDLKGMAAEAERLRIQIQERDAMLTAKEAEVKMVTRTMEEEFSRQLLEKEKFLRERDSAAKQQEETLAARIHDLECQLTEKEAPLEEGREKDLLQSMSAELERLRADLRDRNLLLEARETEVRMIKQSVQEKFKGLERIVQRPQGGEAKKSRLVSLLATVEKRH